MVTVQSFTSIFLTPRTCRDISEGDGCGSRRAGRDTTTNPEELQGGDDLNLFCLERVDFAPVTLVQGQHLQSTRDHPPCRVLPGEGSCCCSPRRPHQALISGIGTDVSVLEEHLEQRLLLFTSTLF